MPSRPMTVRPPAHLRLLGVLLGALLGALLGVLLGICPTGVFAQASDEDAGTDADPGADGADADAGAQPEGEADTGVACSCETLEPRDGQRVHVCTGSFDPDVCEHFTCESSYVTQRPCSAQSVRLCCQMDSRSLYTNLYDDCEHDNCEQGFRDQCRDFGGTVISGLCGGQDPEAGSDRLPPAPTERSKGFCSVSRVGDAPSPTWLLLGLLTGLVVRGRRRVRRRGELRGEA